jgi:hypothetical protein
VDHQRIDGKTTARNVQHKEYCFFKALKEKKMDEKLIMNLTEKLENLDRTCTAINSHLHSIDTNLGGLVEELKDIKKREFIDKMIK